MPGGGPGSCEVVGAACSEAGCVEGTYLECKVGGSCPKWALNTFGLCLLTNKVGKVGEYEWECPEEPWKPEDSEFQGCYCVAEYTGNEESITYQSYVKGTEMCWEVTLCPSDE